MAIFLNWKWGNRLGSSILQKISSDSPVSPRMLTLESNSQEYGRERSLTRNWFILSKRLFQQHTPRSIASAARRNPVSTLVRLMNFVSQLTIVRMMASLLTHFSSWRENRDSIVPIHCVVNLHIPLADADMSQLTTKR